MPAAQRDWLATGVTALGAFVVAAMVYRGRPGTLFLVATPLAGAAVVALWVGRTFPDRPPSQRAQAGRTMALCISVAGLLAAATVLG